MEKNSLKLYATKEVLEHFGLAAYVDDIDDFFGQHAHSDEVLNHLNDYLPTLPPSFDPFLEHGVIKGACFEHSTKKGVMA